MDVGLAVMSLARPAAPMGGTYIDDPDACACAFGVALEVPGRDVVLQVFHRDPKRHRRALVRLMPLSPGYDRREVVDDVAVLGGRAPRRYDESPEG